MESLRKLSVPEKLLIVARGLEVRGKSPFTAEDLVVEAWRSFPDTFGLGGYRDSNGKLMFPDSNRVFAEIMGTKPIRKKGYLTKVGNKLYKLTEAGHLRAELLALPQGKEAVVKAGLDRILRSKLDRLLTSRSFEKYKNGLVSEITFHDACGFWGISPRTTANEYANAVADFKAVVGEARRAFDKRLVSFEHGGKAYGSTDLDNLLKLHNDMIELFHGEISVLMKRSER